MWTRNSRSGRIGARRRASRPQRGFRAEQGEVFDGRPKTARPSASFLSLTVQLALLHEVGRLQPLHQPHQEALPSHSPRPQIAPVPDAPEASSSRPVFPCGPLCDGKDRSQSGNDIIGFPHPALTTARSLQFAFRHKSLTPLCPRGMQTARARGLRRPGVQARPLLSTAPPAVSCSTGNSTWRDSPPSAASRSGPPSMRSRPNHRTMSLDAVANEGVASSGTGSTPGGDVDPFSLVEEDMAKLSTDIRTLVGSDHPILQKIAAYFFDRPYQVRSHVWHSVVWEMCVPQREGERDDRTRARRCPVVPRARPPHTIPPSSSLTPSLYPISLPLTTHHCRASVSGPPSSCSCLLPPDTQPVSSQ